MKKRLTTLKYLYQIPLFFLSFGFFRMMKWALRKWMKIYLKKNMLSYNASKWFAFSELTENKMFLPYTMVTGPRWNCHAVIGAAGPFDVRSCLEIDTRSAFESAGLWTIVLYRDNYRTVTYLSSTRVNRKERWHRMTLAPGTYRMTMRFYQCSKRMVFPMIKADGGTVVDLRSLGDEWNRYQGYLQRVRNHWGIFYFLLHSYIFYLLRWRKNFSKSLVRREYLPVGNPETHFEFGHLDRGGRLQFELSEDFLDQANVYLVFFNACSFPVVWEDITSRMHRTQPITCHGHFLIRVHSKSGGSPTGMLRYRMV